MGDQKEMVDQREMVGQKEMFDQKERLGQIEMNLRYTFLDNIFRLSIGQTGDFTNALYNGDFSMSLDEAQRKKHEFIVDSLDIKEGTNVLDIGCGWGPFLKYVKDNTDAKGIGVSLSVGQVRACKSIGLDVHLMDHRAIKRDTFGTFDAITCIGALEHLCSIEEWQEGKQNEAYTDFFKAVADLLPVGGKFYLQSMVFSKNMIDYEAFDINANKNSDEYILALMEIQQPGSWLPYGEEQIIENALPYFKVINKSSGRLDYIETITQWSKKFKKFNLRKYLIYISLLPRYLTDKKFRYWLAILNEDPNRKCFEREIMDHIRFVFEKV